MGTTLRTIKEGDHAKKSINGQPVTALEIRVSRNSQLSVDGIYLANNQIDMEACGKILKSC